MTPQEEELLNSLTDRVNQTQLQEKDPDAEALLNRSLGSNPDALYILAQTVLVQNIALEQAKAQVAQLQQQTQQRQPARATSFLGSLLGHRDPDPAPVQPAPQGGYQPVNPQYAQPQYVPPTPQYVVAPPYQQPQYVATGQPSFLRGAMQTAAGVAAGALAFEGVESVLHGLGGGGYGGGGFGGPGLMGGGFGERPVEETVVNNYYDDPGQGGGERHFHESSDQGGAQFNDANYTSNDDDQNFGDPGDNSGMDDGSDFGDSGNDSGGDIL